MVKVLLENEISRLAKLCQNDSSIINILISDLDEAQEGSIKIFRDKKTGYVRITFICCNFFYDHSPTKKFDLNCTLDISENAISYKRKEIAKTRIDKEWDCYHYYSIVCCGSYFDYQATKLDISLCKANRSTPFLSRCIAGEHKREIFYGSKKLTQDETDLSELFICGLKPRREPQIIIKNDFALEILKYFKVNQMDHDIDCRLENHRYLLLPENGLLSFRRGISTCTEGDNVFANIDELHVGENTNDDWNKAIFYYGDNGEYDLKRQYMHESLTEEEVKPKAYKILLKHRSLKHK